MLPLGYGVMRTVRCRETNSGEPYSPWEAMAVTENTVTVGELATRVSVEHYKLHVSTAASARSAAPSAISVCQSVTTSPL